MKSRGQPLHQATRGLVNLPPAATYHRCLNTVNCYDGRVGWETYANSLFHIPCAMGEKQQLASQFQLKFSLNVCAELKCTFMIYQRIILIFQNFRGKLDPLGFLMIDKATNLYLRNKNQRKGGGGGT